MTFAPGETSKTLTVEVLDDSVHETAETILVTLSNPAGGAIVGARNVATLTIDDDDPEVPTAQGPFYLAEGATGFFALDFAIVNPNAAPATPAVVEAYDFKES